MGGHEPVCSSVGRTHLQTVARRNRPPKDDIIVILFTLTSQVNAGEGVLLGGLFIGPSGTPYMMSLGAQLHCLANYWALWEGRRGQTFPE